jgi:hypothetical protein
MSSWGHYTDFQIKINTESKNAKDYSQKGTSVGKCPQD